MRGVFCFFGELVGAVWAGVGVGAGRCGLVLIGVEQCRCGFRAGAGAGRCCAVRFSGQCWAVSVSVRFSGRCWCSVGAVFILNGMIFSFLDEKRVFKGVV